MRCWSILADNAAYPEWNHYHVCVNGELSVGNRLEVVIQRPNGNVIEIEPRLMLLEPLREPIGGGGIRGILIGEHVLLLDDFEGGGTRLV